MSSRDRLPAKITGQTVKVSEVHVDFDANGVIQLKDALKQEILPDYISTEMLYPNYDLDRLFLCRAAGFISPFRLTNVNNFLPASTTYIRNAIILDQYTAMYSKRTFKYGAYTHCVRLPLLTEPSWVAVYMGSESTGQAIGGGAIYRFNRGTQLTTQITLATVNFVSINYLEITSLIADPSIAEHRYCVKVNKASAEFYVDAALVGILQCSDESDTYTVRLTAPYILAQYKGAMPTCMPDLFELGATDGAFIGTQPGLQLTGISVLDGTPAPHRALHPITGGVNWGGTVIAAGTLTSDRVPIAGYDDKTILFIATGAGTLYIDVDYGDNNNDQYDSVAVAANTLVTYPMTANPLWLRLRFLPTAFPTTVTRARVLMN